MAAEREMVESERATLRASGAAIWRRMAVVSAAGCTLLAALTVMASDAPTWVVLLFWLAMAVLLTIWTAVPERRRVRAQEGWLTEALRANRVREFRVRSSRVVEFEEIEDEGACYAFELDATRVVVVTGQQYYPTDTFPSDDFAIVQFLSSTGAPIHEMLSSFGRRLVPERIVSAEVKDRVTVPDDLSILPTSLDRVEQYLQAVSPG